MIQKHPTACCALCQLTCGNNDSLTSLRRKIKQLKEESTVQDFLGTSPNYGGQRACFVITTPNEEQLVTNLQKLDFTRTYEFGRRMGYPEGMLTMWMLKW